MVRGMPFSPDRRAAPLNNDGDCSACITDTEVEVLGGRSAVPTASPPVFGVGIVTGLGWRRNATVQGQMLGYNATDWLAVLPAMRLVQESWVSSWLFT